jgi:hypothetical protein
MACTRLSDFLSEARKMKPTRQHRPAVWGGILGTVYAQNDTGETRYFDYDYAVAWAFAGVTPERDPRQWKAADRSASISKGQTVIYIRRNAR